MKKEKQILRPVLLKENKKQKTGLLGFTLVELIVVITILAILGTIAFISLQGYSKDARDSTRLSDINNMKKVLELYYLDSSKYPTPDNGYIVDYDGDTLWTQGTFGEEVIKNIQKLSNIPLDPLTKTQYVYSLANNNREYELLGIFESNDLTNLNAISQTKAADTIYTPKVTGNYNGVFVKSANYIVPVPSIINAEVDESNITLNATNIRSQVLTGYDNIAKVGTISSQTGALDIILSVYTGSINKDSTNQEKLDVITAIQTAYTGSMLVNEDKISQIVNTTDTQELISLTETVVLNQAGSSSSSTQQEQTPTLTGWRVLDPNCDIEDITLGTQTWAGCNSTLGTGIEYTDTNACYDYIGNPTTGCDRPSNEKENVYNPTYGVNNIWGKLYTWTSLDTDNDNDIDSNDTSLVCSTGRHVPTDAEWTTLIDYITAQNGGDANIGWATQSGKDETNNLVKALKLPLTGFLYSDGSTFASRGISTYLWSSSPSSANAYNRRLGWDSSTVSRHANNQDYGFSVRCIKD